MRMGSGQRPRNDVLSESPQSEDSDPDTWKCVRYSQEPLSGKDRKTSPNQ